MDEATMKIITDLQEQVQTLQGTVDSMQSAQSIDPQFEAAIRSRIVRPSMKSLADITKFLTSTPGGVPVMKIPDGFISLQNGRSIPYYLNPPQA